MNISTVHDVTMTRIYIYMYYIILYYLVELFAMYRCTVNMELDRIIISRLTTL